MVPHLEKVAMTHWHECGLESSRGRASLWYEQILPLLCVLQDSHRWLSDDIWKAGKPYTHSAVFSNGSITHKDTHVPRAGRDLIRNALEDANVPVSVRFSCFLSMYSYPFHFSS